MSGFEFYFYVGSVSDYVSENLDCSVSSYPTQAEEYKDVYDKKYVSWDEEDCLVMRAVKGNFELNVGLKIDNVRDFISDLKEFDSEDTGYVTLEESNVGEISGDCAVCGDMIGTDAHAAFPGALNIWEYDDKNINKSRWVYFHRSCVSEFIDGVGKALSEKETVRDLL